MTQQRPVPPQPRSSSTDLARRARRPARAPSTRWVRPPATASTARPLRQLQIRGVPLAVPRAGLGPPAAFRVSLQGLGIVRQLEAQVRPKRPLFPRLLVDEASLVGPVRRLPAARLAGQAEPVDRVEARPGAAYTATDRKLPGRPSGGSSRTSRPRPARRFEVLPINMIVLAPEDFPDGSPGDTQVAGDRPAGNPISRQPLHSRHQPGSHLVRRVWHRTANGETGGDASSRNRVNSSYQGGDKPVVVIWPAFGAGSPRRIGRGRRPNGEPAGNIDESPEFERGKPGSRETILLRGKKP